MKLTAEIGAVRRKSWHLHRPVTVLGSSRTAHIHLADGEVSKVHCALVNTGSHVLVRDLGSLWGTRLNEARLEFGQLRDGDILKLGSVAILVAIRGGHKDRKGRDDDSDPTRMPTELILRAARGDRHWPITKAVATIGRWEESDVFLDAPDLSLTHTIVSHVGGQPVFCDLGTRTGTLINGVSETAGVLSMGDSLKWGQVEVTVEMTSHDANPRRELGTSALLPG